MPDFWFLGAFQPLSDTFSTEWYKFIAKRESAGFWPVFGPGVFLNRQGITTDPLSPTINTRGMFSSVGGSAAITPISVAIIGYRLVTVWLCFGLYLVFSFC